MKKIDKKKILGIALLTSLSIFAGTTANNTIKTTTTASNTANDECRPPHRLQKDSNGNLVDENGNIHHIFRKVKLAEPKMQVKRLANTGSKTTNVTTGFGMLLVGIAAVIRKRKKED